ncbi:MAG: SusC/RagA family TonB-linked outer membrane protein, partial [Marivirga sp.]|nr:SusC/RagA family TonB-linked outer membrane protein [Marivirga sp.]
MRICCCQFLIATTFTALCYSYDIKGQQLLEQPVSLNANNENIKTVLRKIEKELSVKITYRSDVIDAEKIVKVSFDKARLKEVLDELFDHSVRYEVLKRQIILHPRALSDPQTLIQGESPPVRPSQSIAFSVTGVVKDEMAQPLPGVNVIEKGTTNGTTTDANGGFALNVLNEESVLVFSFIGYQSEEVVVGGQATLAIQLIPDIKALQEVVVVGYGEVKKSDLTGSVASIKSEELNAYPATNVMQSLAGRVTGVQVSQNTGSPGSGISVRIRGTNSVQGSNEPLYVVDGFPYNGNPTLLNNADIESIEVLKDASATAIYGSRGANGVVIITTKRGKAGKTMVDYDGYFGWQTVREKIEMMNAREYAEFYNEQAANDGLAPHFTQDEINTFGEGTDWQDVTLQTAPIQNHSISLSGGSEKTKFSISGSSFNQEGIIVGSDYIRNSVRANVSTEISKKFSFDINTILSRIDSDRKNNGGGNRGGSMISAMLSGYPTIGTHQADGSYTRLAEIYSWGSNVITNPLNYIEQETDHIRSNKVLANGAVTFRPIDGLAIKISGGVENTDDKTDFYRTKKFINSQGSASITTQQTTSLLNENTISYVKEFNKHNISAVAGFTYQNNTTTSLNASGSGFVSDIQESFDIGAAATQGVPSSSYSAWALMSYLGRVNYAFNDRYLATVSFRADGSSRYTEGQKWGSFPSASVAWRLSEEQFMKNISVISDLKIRAGYGETGSTAIPPYYTLNQLQSGKVVFGDALFTSYSPSDRLAGPLKWETTAQSDIGLDVGFFENRFSLTLDYYVKNTRDLLNTVPLPSSQGYRITIQNVGKVQNKGFEVAANAVVSDGPFRWDVSANLSMNRNKVLTLYGGNDVLGEAVNISVINDNINILREGEPIGSFFGYIEKGYDSNGKIVYEDFNENGIRDIGDKKIIGNPHPDFIYGFNSTMSYKNFELNVFIQGSQGND